MPKAVRKRSVPVAQYRKEIDDLRVTITALQAENWRLISEKVARSLPPEIWLPLKRAASAPDVAVDYETVRYWCDHGVIVAEKRVGRWYVRMDSLRAHVVALRTK